MPEDAKRIAEKVFKYVEEKFGESVDYARVDGIVRGNGGFVVMGEFLFRLLAWYHSCTCLKLSGIMLDFSGGTWHIF